MSVKVNLDGQIRLFRKIVPHDRLIKIWSRGFIHSLQYMYFELPGNITSEVPTLHFTVLRRNTFAIGWIPLQYSG